MRRQRRSITDIICENCKYLPTKRSRNKRKPIPKESDVKTFNYTAHLWDIYMDNMAKSMRRAGVVWLSMAREVYGSDTPMRIVNEDGSDDVALMTGEVVDRQTGQVIALNDLSQGNYEVTVDVGQSFANHCSFHHSVRLLCTCS